MSFAATVPVLPSASLFQHLHRQVIAISAIALHSTRQEYHTRQPGEKRVTNAGADGLSCSQSCLTGVCRPERGAHRPAGWLPLPAALLHSTHLTQTFVNKVQQIIDVQIHTLVYARNKRKRARLSCTAGADGHRCNK